MGRRADLPSAHRARNADRASSYYEHRAAPATAARAARAERDETLDAAVKRVHQANYSAYGARKVWLALRREQIDVARCTIEASMRRQGLQGEAREGKEDHNRGPPSHQTR